MAVASTSVTVSWRSRRHGGHVATAVTATRRRAEADAALEGWGGVAGCVAENIAAAAPQPPPLPAQGRRRCRHKAAAAEAMLLLLLPFKSL